MSMINWNFNMDEAPRGTTREIPVGNKGGVREVHDKDVIIVAGPLPQRVVTLSYWLPKEYRWCMFTKDEPPIAWASLSHPLPV